MKTFDVNDIQLKIQSPGIEAGDDVKMYVTGRLEKLGKTFSRIKKCELLLKTDYSNRTKKCLAEIKLFVPGTVLFSKESEENFKVALKYAFDDLHVQLTRLKEKFQEKKTETPEEETKSEF